MTGPFFYSPHIQATAMRKQLWKAGFRPVPVLSWTEDADGAGKRPKGFAWPETARLDPPEAACNPAEFDALNTGILCDGLQAIDIDIDELGAGRSAAQLLLSRFWARPRSAGVTTRQGVCFSIERQTDRRRRRPMPVCSARSKYWGTVNSSSPSANILPVLCTLGRRKHPGSS